MNHAGNDGKEISKRLTLDSKHFDFTNGSDISTLREETQPKYLRIFVGDSFSYLHPVTVSSTQNIKWLAFAALQRYNSSSSVGGTVRLRGNLGSTCSVMPEDVIDEATGKIIPPSETLTNLIKFLSSNNPDASIFPIRVRLMDTANAKGSHSPKIPRPTIRREPITGISTPRSTPSRVSNIRSPQSSRLSRAGSMMIHSPLASSRANGASTPSPSTPVRSALQSPSLAGDLTSSNSSSPSGHPVINSTTNSPATRRTLWQACAFNMSANARDAAINLAAQTRHSEKQRISAMRAKAEASYAREVVSQVLSLNDYLASAGDSELVVAHALEQEWEFIRVHMLVSSPADIRLIKSTMLKCWSSLNELYRHFSASELGIIGEDDTSDTMQLDEFIQFALVSGLSPPLNRATLETIFRRANANRSSDANLGGFDDDEDSMTRYEWLEALVLLAESAFATDVDLFSGQRIGIARAFEKLCMERLMPLAEQLGAAPLRRTLRSKPMLVWLSSRLDALKAVYAYYSAVDAKDSEYILGIVSEQFGVNLMDDTPAKPSKSSPRSTSKTTVPVNNSNASKSTGTGSQPHDATATPQSPSVPLSAPSSHPRELVFRFCSDGRYSRTTTKPVRKVDLSDLGATRLQRQAMNFDRFAASVVHAGLAPGYVLSQNDLDVGAINVAEEIWEITGKRPRAVLPLTVPVPGELTGRELRRAFHGSQAEEDGTGLDKDAADEEMVFAEWLEAIARVSLAKWGPMCNYNCSWLAEIPPKDKILMEKAVARAQAKRDFRTLGARLLLQKLPITAALPQDIIHILTEVGYSLHDRDAIQEVFAWFQPSERGLKPNLRINASPGYGTSARSAFPSRAQTPNLSQARTQPPPHGSPRPESGSPVPESQEAETDERTEEEIEEERKREEERLEEERRRREMRVRTTADAILQKLYEKYYCSVEIPPHLETEILTLVLQWGFEQVASSVYCLGKGPAHAIPRDPMDALKGLIAQDAKKVVGVFTPVRSRAPSVDSAVSQAGFRINTDSTITEDDAAVDAQYAGRTVSQASSSAISVNGLGDARDDESIVALALASITDIPGFSETTICKNSSDLFENPLESVAKPAARPKQPFRLPGGPSSLLSPTPSGFHSAREQEYGFPKS